ncbi:N-acetylmuramoyl-L-alanine amidase [Domibacillus robiginosus]|uniref:N-acetylmuramoyl-L-alanine amidase n=1 Tax=Domibacillus robiginosus TaxID=1071054 RepID=UPI00067C6623|nr:N-acetylmuramoyl-L-alanine amidase [Domibacillus robiginosus]
MEKVRLGILLLFLLGLTGLAGQPALAQSQTGSITGDRVNIRESPSLSASVLGQVHTGDRVSILSFQNGWVQISFRNQKAWVSGQYVRGTAQKTASSGEFVRIQTEGTNLRSGPSTSSSVIVQGSVGERYPVTGRSGDWIRIRLASGNEAYVAGWVVSGQSPENHSSASSLQGKVIVLDPGHGGVDGGTSGLHGTIEKNVTLQTAWKLRDALTASGAKVVLTRTGDQYVPLPSRTADARQHGADAFISLHFDGAQSQQAAGFTSYYYHRTHQKLARSLSEGLNGTLPNANRGTQHGDYFVLRENQRPAALLELGYLTNPAEESSIVSAAYQQQAAAGIRDGLASYFSH